MSKALLYFLLVLTMFFWAGNFHATKIALANYGATSVAALRFGIGTLVLLLVLILGMRKKFSFAFSKKEWWHLFLTSFLGIFIGIYFFNLGLKTTSAINGSLIVATGPAIVAILSRFFLNLKLTVLQWLAILISFMGVTIVLVNGELTQLLQLEFALGDIYILFMAIGFSSSQIVISKHLQHIDALTTTLFTCAIGSGLFILFSIPEFLATPVPTDLSFWGSILFMGVLGTGAAYVIYFSCIVQLGATTSNLFVNLIPLFTVLIAVFLGEQLLVSQLIGGSITIAGLLLFRYAKTNT